MKLHTFALSALLALGSLSAQTQLVRGEVDGIQGTNLFQLKCTTVRLTSANLNLQALHDLTHQNNVVLDMQVVDSFGNGSSLEVVAATPVTRNFDMGNLRFGRAETWEVFAAPGSQVWVFVGGGGDTGYTPVGAIGTWLLGPSAVPFLNGTTNATGSARFSVTMPTAPGLVGAVFAAQSVVSSGGALSVTNAECKEVRAN